MGSATTASNRPWRGGSTPIGIQMASAAWLPSDEVSFNEGMMFSAAWSVQDRTPLRRTGADFTQNLQETYRRSQPLLEQLKICAAPHQHFLGDINVAGSSTPCIRSSSRKTRSQRDYCKVTLVSTMEASRVPGRDATDDQEGLLSSNHRQTSLKIFGRPDGEHYDFLFQSWLEHIWLNLAGGTNFHLYTRYCWLSGQRNALLT